MVMDAVRGYVQLANGLTEVTRQKAQAAAKALLQQTGADRMTTKVSDLADEIVATSKSNRQLLQAIVTNEVEGAVARLGFVRSEEVAALTRRVKLLEEELAEARAAGAGPTPAAPSAAPAAPIGDALLDDEPRAAGTGPVGGVAEDAPTGGVGEDGGGPGPVAAKVAGKKAAAKKAAKKAPAKKAAGKKVAKAAAAKKAPAKKTAAGNGAAKKAAAATVKKA